MRSDLSVLHRVDDINDMDARTFVSRVIRLPAYDGVIAALLAREVNGEPAPGPGPSTAGPSEPGPAQTLSVDELHAMNNSVLYGPMGDQSVGLFEIARR